MKTENAKHTPGPWRINELKERSYYIIYSSHKINNVAVAEVCGPEAGANAHIIAAAPDLLAAAKAALVTFQDDELYGMSKNVREVLEQAISKAEGKS